MSACFRRYQCQPDNIQNNIPLKVRIKLINVSFFLFFASKQNYSEHVFNIRSKFSTVIDVLNKYECVFDL